MQKQAPSAEMIEAIESGNYDAWVVLHEGKEGPMLDAINADNFGKLQEMHEARQDSDFEAAKAIAEELGLPTRNKNMKKGMNKEMKKMGASAEMIKAIESGDYDAWVVLHEGKEGPMIDAINADNFGKLQEMHEARQDSDFEAAKAIAEELGLPNPPAKKGMGRGMNNQQ